MYNEINIKLEEAQQGVLRLQKIDTMLEELRKQKSALTKKISELKIILEKENLDVEKLEGKGLAHMFHSMLGNLEEHLDKERQEAVAVQLKYDQAVRDLDTINYQISGLVSEMGQYKECESTYQELYAKKKELLLQSNAQSADRILKLTDRINLLNNHTKEVKEAISAGYNVISHLDSATESLSSAEGWGTWDLLGGGLISDLAKHSHIDDATSEVEESQKALLRFKTELADVQISNSINIETGGFAQFADFFFDGLIADWCMQSRIHDSQDSVNETRNQVEQVLSKLNSMLSAEASQVGLLESEMNTLITQAM